MRAVNIGKTECVYYRESNSKQVCEVGPESGISINETDGSIADYTSFIENKANMVIGGKQFIKTINDIGSGEMETYYMALGASRTLIVIRLVENTYDVLRQDGFPQQSLFDQILSTLVIK